MSFDPNTLALSFLLGFVGLGLFIYGKKAARVPQLIAGALFMVYPYFTPTLTWTIVVGISISMGLWWVLWMGW